MMLTKLLRSTFSTLKSSLTDIVDNHTHIDNSTRLRLLLLNAKNSVVDPADGNHISHLSDLTSFSALIDIRERMMDNEVGRQILREKPRVDSSVTSSLQNCKQGTFGEAYHHFMSSHGFDPSERPLVKYIPDLQLAYVLQRYKQIHDFLHVLLVKEISINDQLIVKWFQMVQLRLPSASLAALVSPVLMGPRGMWSAFSKEIPQAVSKAKKCNFIMNIYFQKHFDQDLGEFRREIGLQ